MSRFSLRLTARYLLHGAATLVVGSGCSDVSLDWPATEPTRGVIVMIPGVEGGAWQLAEARAGLIKGGVSDHLMAIDWGVRPFGSLVNLSDLEANQRRAAIIADRITREHRENPSRPIRLIGYSGGGGLALLVASALPEDVRLEQIILFAAAISPTYDLTRALQRARGGIVNFYSAQDRVVLGLGTRTFGTIDRSKCDAAGQVGFQTPDGRIRERPGLIQIAWTPAWRRLGHDGGHVGWLARNWACEVLAPMLRTP